MSTMHKNIVHFAIIVNRLGTRVKINAIPRNNRGDVPNIGMTTV